MRDERPDLYKGFNPWERVDTPAALAALLREGAAEADEVSAESGSQPLRSPQDFWTIALGSGYRATIRKLDGARERVRLATLDYLSKNNVRSVETNAVYAIARKP